MNMQNEEGQASFALGRMIEASESQAKYRGLTGSTMRREVDIRRAAWWRVRGLQNSSHALPFLGTLCLSALAAMMGFRNPDSIPFWIFILPLITVVWAVIAAFGCRRAWGMARVARLQPSVHVRYVLLHSYASEAPWLVFFPRSGGDEVEPMGALALKYGPMRDRLRDLPEPIGIAALTGEVSGASVVVPWINDRPVWPAASFKEINLSDPRHSRMVSELIRAE
ncbi:hypothetical protein [Streptomyces sp. NBC_00385]|uniref:hypothetical protein n=1 Tax=Streptomyces sp. NBC_00385 TaxID=2975733 RepID=UPI002DDC6ADF|nr:hypothetical protein [Streptomyces sp. NBC_00385]WRZ02612.1 hypothetical protein OG959_04270 [Streptomyces sp. NBC_00385]